MKAGSFDPRESKILSIRELLLNRAISVTRVSRITVTLISPG